jgi:hypothetical protein
LPFTTSRIAEFVDTTWGGRPVESFVPTPQTSIRAALFQVDDRAVEIT